MSKMMCRQLLSAASTSPESLAASSNSSAHNSDKTETSTSVASSEDIPTMTPASIISTVPGSIASRKRVVSDISVASNEKHEIMVPSSSPKSSSFLMRLMQAERDGRSKCSDHIALLQAEDPSYIQNQVWRERVAQWCYDVLDYLEESRDVAYVAMSFMDRYLAVLSKESSIVPSSIGRFDYEVISFTALFLAIRVAGSNRELHIPELLELSSCGAQSRHVLAAGNSMLEKLSWNHRILTPNIFLKELLGLLVCISNTSQSTPSSSSRRRKMMTKGQALTLLDFATYMVEISVCDVYFSTLSPSEVALAALAVAMTCDPDLATGQQESFSQFLQAVHEQTSMDIESVHMKSIISRLLDVYNQSQEAASAAAAGAPERNCHGDSNKNSTALPHIITDEDYMETGVSVSPEPAKCTRIIHSA